MGFEPTMTKFRSDALTNSAMRSWVQLALRANFVQLLQFHRLFSVIFHFGDCLCQSPHFFSSKLSWGNPISVAEWADTYGIHHWMILWGSYIKLAREGFGPATTEFLSDALTHWAIRSWVHVGLRANFVKLLQLHHWFSIMFHFAHCLPQSPRFFSLKLSWGNHMSVAESADTYGIHHWRILRSSYRKLDRVKFESKIIEFRSDALNNWAIRPWVQLVVRANFVQLFQLHRLFNIIFHFGHCLRQSPRLFSSKFCWGNHRAEWADTYGIRHWRILWSCRKLSRAGFEPTMAEFTSEALTDWAIIPWI